MYTEKNVKVILSNDTIRKEFITSCLPQYCKRKRNGDLKYDDSNGKSLKFIVDLLNKLGSDNEMFYNYVCKKVISKGGRFYDIANNYDKYRSLELDLSKEISKSGKDDYSPDTFENQIVKPWFRKV